MQEDRMTARRLCCIVGILAVFLLPATAWTQTQSPALPATIPIFPLPELVLFPHVSVPLTIFEPRYRMMLMDAVQGDRIIGIVLLKPGYQENYEGRPPVYAIGCAAAITDVIAGLPDGRIGVVLRGLVKFRITGENESRSYRLARVEQMDEPVDADEKVVLRRQRRQLEALLSRPGSTSDLSRMFPSLSDEELFNTLAHNMKVDVEQRQMLLERDGVLARSQAILDLLAELIPPLKDNDRQ
jgi:Lon protease-like protein